MADAAPTGEGAEARARAPLTPETVARIATAAGYNRKIIEEFRANGGKTFGIFRDQPLLLLTTTGAKSGEPRTTPVVYTRDGDRSVIVASNGGTASHPSWFLYVVAHPEVTVDGGSERLTMRAAVAEGEARDRLYARQAAAMPAFTAYQAKTERRIPIIVLEKVE